MADYPELTPEQMLMLRQFGGLQASGDNQTFETKGGNENFNTSVRGFDTPAAQAANASMMAGVQLADKARLSAMLNAATLSTKQGDMATINPAVSAQMGKLQAMYGQQIADGQRQSQNVGASYDFGPVQAGISKSYADRGPSPTIYNASVPFDFGSISGAMIKGKNMPTSYQGAVQVPGLLGGSASLAAEYTPSTKDKAVYAKWKKRF